MKPYKIFGEEYIDENAKGQFYEAMKLDTVVQGALMPDAHFGYALPIGGVVATVDTIYPAWVGYDIGCGMCAVPTTYHVDEIRARATEIFEEIYEHVPVGFKHNKRPVTWRDYGLVAKTPVLDKMFWDKGGLKQLGTLGGGNHFIEIGEGDNNIVWIIVHSGSRNVGHSIATYYMKEACFLATGKRKAREGHYGFKVESRLGADYIDDLKFCETFALVNREQIIHRIAKALRSINIDGEPDFLKLINRNHNHVEFRNDMIIHRKGATHADKGMLGVIPGNMRDGSFIVCGRGNPKSLYSSSHGAGRVLGRKQAKEQINVKEFENAMAGVTANVSQNTVDESPMAYKNISLVMKHQENLVDILYYISPIINVKG